jgi:hypothetical protein
MKVITRLLIVKCNNRSVQSIMIRAKSIKCSVLVQPIFYSFYSRCLPFEHLPIFVLLVRVSWWRLHFVWHKSLIVIFFHLDFFQQTIRTAKVFKPNLLITKHRNIKVQDGQWVEKDAVLTLQNNLNLYPGENVNEKIAIRFCLFLRFAHRQQCPHVFVLLPHL